MAYSRISENTPCNPEAYLNHLLTVLPERFAADPQAVVDDLLPWSEEMQTSFRTSDVDHQMLYGWVLRLLDLREGYGLTQTALTIRI